MFLKERKNTEGDFFFAHFGTPAFSFWRGLAFENVCFCHISQIRKALSIGGVALSASSYFKKGEEENPGLQIDLVLDREDNVISLCEAKFTSLPFEITKDYHLALVSRREEIQRQVSPKKRMVNVLISSFGLKKNMYSGDFHNVVTLEDLFRE